MTLIAKAAAVALAFRGTAGLADPVICDCRVNAAVADGGLVQPQYLFQYEPGAKTAEVFDGLIKQFGGKPVEAKAKDEAARTTFTWKLMVTTQGSSLPLVFRATLFKADQRFVVDGQASGGEFRGDGGAEGTCTPRQAPLMRPTAPGPEGPKARQLRRNLGPCPQV